MTRAKKLSKSLMAMVLVVALLLTMIPVIVGTMNANAQTYDGRKHRLGCWWWYYADATNTTTRDNYLGLLEETGVTEVYIEAYTSLWTTSNHASLHNFVQAAQQHGMRTSVMIDDPGLATSAATSSSYINKLYNGWVAYKNTYPDDWLYGIHFDVEPGGYNTSVLQKYCDNLLNNALNVLVANGVYVEFDVNPAWAGAESVEFDIPGDKDAKGEQITTKDFYQILAKALGGGKGTVSLMSYRTKPEKVMSRANERKAVDYAIQYNCDFTYGIETDKVDSAIDISSQSKAYLCSMLDYIYGQIDTKNYPMDAGVAIHHARSYYNYLSGALPTTSVYVKGGTTASRPTYTTKPTQPTKPHSGTLTKKTIWEGDLNATVIIENYSGALNNAEIDAAIRADLTANGTIEDDEYYEIFTRGYMQGQSGYAVAGFLTGEFEFWGDDKAQYCATIGESAGLTCQKLIGKATDKKGNLLAPDLNGDFTQLAYFSDAEGYTDKVYITHIEINVYRYSGDSPDPSQSQSQSQSQTQPTFPSSAPVEGNLIKNSSFDNGLTDWRIQNLEEGKTVNANGAQLSVNTDDAWHVSIRPTINGTIKPHTQYTLQYDASNVKNLQVRVHRADGNGNDSSLVVQPGKTVFETGDLEESGIFYLIIENAADGAASGTFDNFVLVEGTQIVTQTTPSSSQTTPSSSQTTPSSSQTTPSSSQTNPTEPVQSQSMTLPTIPSKPLVDIIWGDADDDCEITMKDVLVMRMELANMSVYIDLKTADANGDGEFNMKDVLAVRKFMAGLIEELGPNAA